MGSFFLTATKTLAAAFLLGEIVYCQTPGPTADDTVRVKVTVNADGSRTVYRFDPAYRKATATTTERDGKTRETIEYDLDEAGRFASGRIFGADGRFRFRSLYKYDSGGRLEQETQFGKEDAVTSKIVYSYDPKTGKQTGYSIFDGAGKLVGQVPSPTPPPKQRKK